MVPWFIVKIARTLNNGKNLYEKDKNWIHKVDYIHTKAEAYREPCQIPKMELFQTLTIFAKSLVLDVWLGSRYASEKLSN